MNIISPTAVSTPSSTVIFSLTFSTEKPIFE